MDLENQKRVKEFVEQYGAENIVVLLGAAEGEGAGLAAETVTNGDPTFAGPLAGVCAGILALGKSFILPGSTIKRNIRTMSSRQSLMKLSMMSRSV